jgi:hypothetical protein
MTTIALHADFSPHPSTSASPLAPVIRRLTAWWRYRKYPGMRRERRDAMTAWLTVYHRHMH